MSRDLTVRLVQFASEWMDPERNLERVSSFVSEAGSDDVDIVVFPELTNLGYITPVRSGGEMEYPGVSSESEFRQLYAELSETIPGAYTNRLSDLAGKHRINVVIGMAVRREGDLFNSAVLVDRHGDVHMQDKLHIPLNEKSFFTAGNELVLAEVEGAQIGLTVCYDSRFPEISRAQVLAGAELVISVLAGPDLVMDILGTPETLIHRAHVRAQENGVFYAVCNRTGSQGSTRFIGHSGISAPSGQILVQGGWEEEVLDTVIDLSQVSGHSKALGVLADRRPELYKQLGLVDSQEPMVAK